jgi:hypothetical protein
MRTVAGRLAVATLVGIALCLSAYAVLLARRMAAEQRVVANRLTDIQSSLSWTIAEQGEQSRRLRVLIRVAQEPWVASPDGKVQARIVAEQDVVAANRRVLLVIEIRNATDAPLTVDGLLAIPEAVGLRHDGNPDPYAGAQKMRTPPPPVSLSPGAVEQAVLELTWRDFPSLASPGEFAVEFTYSSGVHSKESWKGQAGPMVARWSSR